MNLTLQRADAARASRPSEQRHVSPSRRHLALVLLLALPLAAWFSSATSTHALTPEPPPAASPTPFPTPPNPLVLDLTKPLQEEQKFHLGFPLADVPVEVKGDNKEWWLIKFEKLPLGLSVKVSERVGGYSKDQTLLPGRWYSVKSSLPLQLSFGQSVTSPVAMRVRTGTLSDIARGEVEGYESRDVQSYANSDKPDRVREVGPNSYSIEFYYGQYSQSDISDNGASSSAPSTAGATLASSPASTGTTTSPSAVAYVPYALGVFGLLFAIIALIMWRKSSAGDPQNGHELPTVTSSGREIKSYTREEGSFLSRQISRLKGRRGQGAEEPPPAREAEPHGPPDLRPPAARQPKPSQTPALDETSDALSSKSAQTDDQQVPSNVAQQLAAVRADIEQLRAALENKQDADSAKIYGLIQGSVRAEITPTERKLHDEIDRRVNPLVHDLDEVEKKLRGEIDAGKNEVKSSIERTVRSELKGVAEAQDIVFSNVEQSLEEQKRVVSRVEAVERDAELRANVLYNGKLLGFVLDKRLDVLQGGRFDDLVDEVKRNLDTFIRDEVGRNGDGSFGDLQGRAEEVMAAFHEVVVKLSELKADGDGEARQLDERVGGTVTELSELGAQLKEHQLDIKVTLHIPVTAHSRARRSFFEELGLAIQQQFEKLSDPLLHIGSELERLATSEVIGLADICDRRFPPGANAELEGRLKKLFERAGLQDIVPQPGGEFETGNQELLGMVDGQPHQSLKVAQVLSRGFFYRQKGEKTLLRKAGVKVYR